MARNSLDGTGWLVEGRDSAVVKRIVRTSVIESDFRPINMTTNVVEIPRIEDMDVEVVPKGGAYGEDQSGADTIKITARKFGKALRIAEEDEDDEKLGNYLEDKKASWGGRFAVKLDNAGLGTTAAENGGTVPFTSLYRTLTTADATTGYVADANYRSGTELTYDALSDLMAVGEEGDYYEDASALWIAHPRVKSLLRGLKDGDGRPLFVPDVVNGNIVDTILGKPVKWTNGAKTSATATSKPAGAGGAKGAEGNPLLAFVNREYAVVGKRSGPESVYIPGKDGLSALTDESILKVRARRAVGFTTPEAHAIFELTKAA